MYLNRTMCEVLHEMRECTKTRNYSYLLGLIEEAQSMANRMEAKLGQVKDIEKVDKRWTELKDKMAELRAEEKKAGIDKGYE